MLKDVIDVLLQQIFISDQLGHGIGHSSYAVGGLFTRSQPGEHHPPVAYPHIVRQVQPFAASCL